MEIKEFQEKLASLCKLANENDKQLTGDQVGEFFEGMKLEKDQLLLIFRYLKSQGIQIDGAELSDETDPEEKKQPDAGVDEKENPCLTDADKEYLQQYLSSLEMEASADPMLRKFMPMAAELAAEMYRDGMYLADLIQDANLSLLTILAGDIADKTDEEIATLLRKGVKQAVDVQDEQNFEDDCLVAKVQNLDSVMKELTDGDEAEPKFSVEELAIMLDMDIDEMKDIIRLTGDM